MLTRPWNGVVVWKKDPIYTDPLLALRHIFPRLLPGSQCCMLTLVNALLSLHNANFTETIGTKMVGKGRVCREVFATAMALEFGCHVLVI